ncbi:MAG: Ig-like domain-containing protein, partial [Verrucomicrobiota bacterium]
MKNFARIQKYGAIAVALLLGVSTSHADGPGFSQTGADRGTLLKSFAREDLFLKQFEGETVVPSNALRTATAMYHRGYLITDTRDSNQINVWDISDITDWKRVKYYPSQRPFHVFFFTEDELYFNATGTNGWRDFSEPEVAIPKVDDWPGIVGFNAQNRDWVIPPYAYLGQNGYLSDNVAVPILDLRTETPTVLDSINYLESHNQELQPIVIGNLMLACSSFNGTGVVATYDVSDPANPKFLDVISGFRIGYEAAIYEHYVVMSAIIESVNNHTTFIDFSDPENLKVTTEVTGINGAQPRYIQFKDNYMFVGNDQYDLTDVANPVHVHQYEAADDEYHMVLGNMLITFGHVGDATVHSIDANPDSTGPAVAYHLPHDGETGLSPTSRIGVVIHEYLDYTTVNDATYFVRNTNTGNLVPGYIVSSDKDILTFTPDEELAIGSTYEVTLTTGIKDVAGNPMASDYIFTFTVGEPAADNAAPEITDLALSAYPATAGVPLTISATAFDPNFDPVEFRWSFDAGTTWTPWSSAGSIEYTFATEGRRKIELQVRDDDGQTTPQSIQVTAITPPSGLQPLSSQTIILDDNNGRIWTVNPDNATVTAIDTATQNVVFEVSVGADPRGLALAPDGTIWVACTGADRIDILSATSGAILDSIDLGWGSRPHDIAFTPDGSYGFTTLDGSWSLARLDPVNRTLDSSLTLGRKPRAIAINGDSSTLWVTRFISSDQQGEVWEVDIASMTLNRTMGLAPETDPALDDGDSGRGVPNYVAGVALDPQGSHLWVSSKKDNIFRGTSSVN